ncbi:MAG: hypothetical protein DIJKHBIC_04057 [Thermoanaerobaculia bacterium]|nr:hypothetical protein [Thermoanaerobaculia bacterium]
MEKTRPDNETEERPRERKRWEPPAFISEEPLELIAAACNSGPIKTLSQAGCTVVSS